jgi:hypothetical protein
VRAIPPNQAQISQFCGTQDDICKRAANAHRRISRAIEITHGHLWVKGRFGFEFVQRRRREE